MFNTALKKSLPLSFGYFVVSFAFGASCVDKGLSVWVPVLMSFFVYAGAAQFTFLALFVSGATILTITVTTFLINLRHMFMSIYMGKNFESLNLKKIHKVIYGAQLTDESFAFHSLDKKDDLKDYTYYISFNMACHLSWILGALFGASFFKLYGSIIQIPLDYALTAMMLYVLITLINCKIKFIIALLSIFIGVFLKFILNSSLDIFITTFIVTGVALWLKKKI